MSRTLVLTSEPAWPGAALAEALRTQGLQLDAVELATSSAALLHSAGVSDRSYSCVVSHSPSAGFHDVARLGSIAKLMGRAAKLVVLEPAQVRRSRRDGRRRPQAPLPGPQLPRAATGPPARAPGSQPTGRSCPPPRAQADKLRTDLLLGGFVDGEVSSRADGLVQVRPRSAACACNRTRAPRSSQPAGDSPRPLCATLGALKAIPQPRARAGHRAHPRLRAGRQGGAQPQAQACGGGGGSGGGGGGGGGSGARGGGGARGRQVDHQP